jgi:hypothetical protein
VRSDFRAPLLRGEVRRKENRGVLFDYFDELQFPRLTVNLRLKSRLLLQLILKEFVKSQIQLS